MADDEIKIIPMGKSPIHEAMEWAVMYELLCKQVAIAFGVPQELLTPSNKVLHTDGGNRSVEYFESKRKSDLHLKAVTRRRRR